MPDLTPERLAAIERAAQASKPDDQLVLLHLGMCDEDEVIGTAADLAALCRAVRELQAERYEARDATYRVLAGMRQKDGKYLHLVECSGNRYAPPGTTGISCCCLPYVARALTGEAE